MSHRQLFYHVSDLAGTATNSEEDCRVSTSAQLFKLPRADLLAMARAQKVKFVRLEHVSLKLSTRSTVETDSQIRN